MTTGSPLIALTLLWSKWSWETKTISAWPCGGLMPNSLSKGSKKTVTSSVALPAGLVVILKQDC